MIHSTSSFGLFFKLSVDNAHKVRYFIHFSSANLVILTTLSAQALCHATAGKNLAFAHLRFQSIIIQRCFIIFY
jgi:hypothetical protein